MSWDDLIDGLNRECLEVFSTQDSATYFPAAGDSYPIYGIFDREHKDIDPETGAPILSNRPSFWIVSADLLAPIKPGDRLEIDQIMYRIISHEEDGKGAFRLLLHKA